MNSNNSNKFFSSGSPKVNMTAPPGTLFTEACDENVVMTVGMFKNELEKAKQQILLNNEHLVQKFEEYLALKTKGISRHTLSAPLERYADVLRQRFGTAKQRLDLMRNPDRYGKRNLAKPRGSTTLKAPFIDTMKKYYAKREDSSSKAFFLSDDELEDRYSCTYKAVKMFVTVQVIPGTPGMTNVSKVFDEKRDFYCLMIEDMIESQLGSGKDGTGLPLFSTLKHYGAMYFLSVTIRAVLKEHRTRPSLWNKDPAVGGPPGRNNESAVLLCKTQVAADDDGVKVKLEEVKQELASTGTVKIGRRAPCLLQLS